MSPRGPPVFLPPIPALLRVAIRVRLQQLPDGAGMLTAAIKTLCDEITSQGGRVEEMVVILRDAWQDVNIAGVYIPELREDFLYVQLLSQALVIFYASHE